MIKSQGIALSNKRHEAVESNDLSRSQEMTHIKDNIQCELDKIRANA